MKFISTSFLIPVILSCQCFDTTTSFTTNPIVQQRILNKNQNNHLDDLSPTIKTKTTTNNKKSLTQLHASPLSLISSPLGSIAILAGIVVVHEAGHYLAAKRFGISVEEFSVGFGPKLFSFKAPNNDEFSLRLFPLGGYVKFPENYNITYYQELAQAEQEAASEFLKNTARPDMGIGSKLLNAVTLGAIEDRLWEKEKKRRKQELEQESVIYNTLDQQKIPFWKRLLGQRNNNNNKAITTSSNKDNTFLTTDDIEYYDDPNLLQNRPWQERAVVLSGGVIFNLLLAFSIYFGQINFGPGLPVPQFDNGIVVTANPRPDAASNGILQKGDVIVAIDGKPIMSTSAFDSQKAINKFIEQIRTTPDGENIKLTIKHPNSISNNPDLVIVEPKRNTPSSPKTIGALLSPNYVKMDVMKTNNPIEAADLSFKYVTTLTKETANGLLSFLAGFITGGGSSGTANSAAQVSGPIGLIKTGSDIVSTKDWTTVLLFAAAISINLGVINSIPLPALDGGQLVFVLAEAITGRKVDQKIQENITGVAVLFLILLSAGTFVGDLSNLFR